MKKCYWCNKKIIKLNRDHFIPLSSGGRNTNSNIVDSCEFCNKSKIVIFGLRISSEMS